MRNSGNNGIRLLAQMAAALAIWFVTLAVANVALAGHGHGYGTALRALLAGLGIAGFLPWLYVSGKTILAQDEFTQRVHLVAIAFAFAATALLSLASDFLEKAGFVGPQPAGSMWIAMVVVWWLSILGASRYYR